MNVVLDPWVSGNNTCAVLELTGPTTVVLRGQERAERDTVGRKGPGALQAQGSEDRPAVGKARPGGRRFPSVATLLKDELKSVENHPRKVGIC